MLTKIEMFRHILINLPNIRFNKKRSAVIGLLHITDGRTDRYGEVDRRIFCHPLFWSRLPGMEHNSSNLTAFITMLSHFSDARKLFFNGYYMTGGLYVYTKHTPWHANHHSWNLGFCFVFPLSFVFSLPCIWITMIMTGIK